MKDPTEPLSTSRMVMLLLASAVAGAVGWYVAHLEKRLGRLERERQERFFEPVRGGTEAFREK